MPCGPQRQGPATVEGRPAACFSTFSTSSSLDNHPTPWILRHASRDHRATLANSSLGRELPELVIELLAQRGFCDPDRAETFLNPRLEHLTCPFEVPGMRAAAERILAAADRGERVVVYGDYDVDGVTSVALMLSLLEAYGVQASWFLPERMEDGYGITRSGLERCFGQGEPQLLIAVDCGTSSCEEIAWLRGRDIDVVVLDHHEAQPGGTPDASALVNPKLGDGYHYFCSAGLVFKLGHALLKLRRLDGFDLRRLLDLAAIGTVADIVPLVEENRILVRKGLRCIETTTKPGLRALMQVAGVRVPMSAGDIGFRIGPRINAAGRLASAGAALALLRETSMETALSMAEDLNQQNRSRQQVEHTIFAEAEALLRETCDPVRDAAIVIGSRQWHPGVVGIVAARLMRAHHRPAIVIAFDKNGSGKGSGRSIPGVSLIDGIEACRDLLVNGGGHQMAAGVSLHWDQLDAFRRRFCDHIRLTTPPECLLRKVETDIEVRLADLDLRLLDTYQLLEPFGSHNPQPMLLARDVQQGGAHRVLSDKHLKLTLYQDGAYRDAVWFNAPLDQVPPPPWDVAFTIQRNVFRGRESLQLLVQHLRHASSQLDEVAVNR